MCGIAGIWRKAVPISEADLVDVAAMTATLSHRGPNGEGAWNGSHLALGHRRLSIFDPSPAAGQPMLTEKTDGVLVYNGAVYNFEELRATLVREGSAFRTGSDTEVVLEALHRWGPAKAVALFDGMFAFAYFDCRRSELWLGRDRLGIKPLSVADRGDRLIFASEDKAILACAGFPRDVDPREITLRLAWQYRDSGASLFRGIARLPPGSLWKITARGIEKTRYWHVLDVLDTGRITARPMPDSWQTDTLEALLSDSVRSHCRSDKALGTACSSGVDSGLVTAMASRFRHGMPAYVVDPQAGHSEAEDAERSARHAGVEIRRVPLDRELFLDLWPRMVWHLESDGWHSSGCALLALADRCRTDGVEVLLTGEGADELFGGYPWHRDSMRMWRTLAWPWSLLRSRRSLDRRVISASGAPFRHSMGRSSAHERTVVLQSLAPELNFLQTRIFDLLEPVGPPADRAFLGSCIFDLYGHLQDLLHRHDRLAMASSVELRVPFLENRLIDFAIHLPRPLKYRGGTTKWLLKKVAERHLPQENIRSRKIGFGISGALSLGGEVLLEKGLLREVLRWPADSVPDMVALASRSESARMRLVGMELFLRLFVEGETIDGLSEMMKASQPGTVAADDPRAGPGDGPCRLKSWRLSSSL